MPLPRSWRACRPWHPWPSSHGRRAWRLSGVSASALVSLEDRPLSRPCAVSSGAPLESNALKPNNNSISRACSGDPGGGSSQGVAAWDVPAPPEPRGDVHTRKRASLNNVITAWRSGRGFCPQVCVAWRRSAWGLDGGVLQGQNRAPEEVAPVATAQVRGRHLHQSPSSHKKHEVCTLASNWSVISRQRRTLGQRKNSPTSS